MAMFNLQNKMTKNNLRIISKLHAYLQTMTKTPVKFQKNQYKTVGEVAPTRYLLPLEDGQTDRKTERHKISPSAFLWKGGGQKMNIFPI